MGPLTESPARVPTQPLHFPLHFSPPRPSFGHLLRSRRMPTACVSNSLGTPITISSFERATAAPASRATAAPTAAAQTRALRTLSLLATSRRVVVVRAPITA